MRYNIKYASLAVLLCLFTVSCSNKPDGGLQNLAIEIHPEIESLGRATDNSFTDGDRIGVYVSKFNGSTPQPLQSQGNYADRGDNVAFIYKSGVWSCSPVLYWMPGNTDKIEVYGYYPYQTGVTDALSLSVTVAQDQSGDGQGGELSAYQASDFMYAKSSTAVDYGTPVADGFVFKHKLSKVTVDLRPGDAISQEQLERATVTINGTKLNTSINLATGSLADQPSGNVESIMMRKNSTIFEAIIIPQTITNIDLIQIDIDGKKFKYTGSFTFVENNSHTFVITVSEEAIKVVSNSVTGWIEDIDPWQGDVQGPQKQGAVPYMSASFIQSWLIMGWEDDRWQQELTLLKSVGIKDIIIDQSLWYYELDEYGNGKKYLSLLPLEKSELGMSEDIALEWGTTLQAMLVACKRNGVGVYVGLNFDKRHWFKAALNRATLLHQAQMGNALMDKVIDLYGSAYSETIKGWYWSWEVDNVNFVNKTNQTLLADMLAINVNHRNSDPKLNKPIMLSPFMNPRGGGLGSLAYKNMWIDVFGGVDLRPGDVMAPQDCMGTGYLTLQTAGRWLGDLSMATATKPGVEFWVNTEIFSSVGGTFQTAKVTDVVDRLRSDSKFASRLACFSYSHYFSSYVNAGFEQYHQQYKQYYDSFQ